MKLTYNENLHGWMDAFGNLWEDSLYTEESATLAASSMKNCRLCVNCEQCTSCEHCSHCKDCTLCAFSEDLKNCVDCDFSCMSESCSFGFMLEDKFNVKE